MNRPNDHLRDAAAVGLLFLAVIGCTWRIALAGRVLAGGDVFTYFYPYWAAATRAIRVPRLPLWNPTLFMGVPLVANSQVGFFYPLNWLLWLLLPAHRSVHVTILLHLCLAALSAYLWGRGTLRLGRLASWIVGAVFALGGYLGAQVEHVNQLQALAWLPLMLMLSDRLTRPTDVNAAGHGVSARTGCEVPSLSERLKASCGLGVVIALVLLAGHTQTAFISLFGLAVYGLVPLIWRSLRGADWASVIRGAAWLGVGAILGVMLAAVQILTTWQLSRLSVRAQGLPFNERVSFSLSPLYVARALLPAFGRPIAPDHLEHVAYVGTTGLALALVGLVMKLRCPRGKRQTSLEAHHAVYPLVLLGVFFAFGRHNPLYVLLARYVPGFAHFRVPARWLALYASGIAALAGQGVQMLWDRRSPDRRALLVVPGSLGALALWAVASAWLDGGRSARSGLDLVSVVGWVGVGLGSAGLLLVASRGAQWAAIGLVALLMGELFLAGSALPHARATAPQAFTSLRPAVAHLLASQRSEAGAGERFLSMSDTTFDPGDLSLIKSIYGPQLSDDQLYDYVVATKQKEILSPNLPLAFGVPAVDGYGGGLLPLQRYVTLQRAFLSAQDVSIDGRLRENLRAIPEGRWLSLFNVRYVITDKLQDAWIDDVFYDLQFGARLSQGATAAIADVPSFEATALGVVSSLEPGSTQSPGSTLPEGTPVGVVRLAFDEGDVRSFELLAGKDVPESLDGEQAVASMATRLRWSAPRTPLTVTVEATASDGVWVVRGLSLIDERTGGFQSLVVSDRGRFRLAHSGDVKIYENLDVLPRAFIVPQAQIVDDDEAALTAMKDPTLDLSSQAVLSGGGCPRCESEIAPPGGDQEATGAISSSARATMVAYEPERVVIEAVLEHPGYLMLTDAYYPGWHATVDGEPVPICRADLLFRAVPLQPGEHRVVFAFRSRPQVLGMLVTIVGLAVLVMVWHERRIAQTGLRCYNWMHGWANGARSGKGPEAQTPR
jgi:hypothetical protein